MFSIVVYFIYDYMWPFEIQTIYFKKDNYGRIVNKQDVENFLNCGWTTIEVREDAIVFKKRIDRQQYEEDINEMKIHNLFQRTDTLNSEKRKLDHEKYHKIMDSLRQLPEYNKTGKLHEYLENYDKRKELRIQ